MSDDTPVKTPAQLQEQLEATERELQDAQIQFGLLHGRVNDLAAELQWLRRRVASFHPERRHCPKCRALVGSTAARCSSCGHRWGRPPDPRAGQPL